jgi:hypothetical protein
MSAIIRSPRETTDSEPLTRHTTDCPECEASLVEGQGVATCLDCAWTGRYE